MIVWRCSKDGMQENRKKGLHQKDKETQIVVVNDSMKHMRIEMYVHIWK